MRTTWRSMALAGALAVAGIADFAVSTAQAQSGSSSYVPNTYADFPYNQGSLFYRPLGSNASRRPRATATRQPIFSRVFAPRTQAYQQPAQVYQQPAQVYRQPAQVYQQPAQAYRQPAQAYQQPAQVYQQPAQAYRQPAQVYQQPAQTYRQPTQYYYPQAAPAR